MYTVSVNANGKNISKTFIDIGLARELFNSFMTSSDATSVFLTSALTGEIYLSWEVNKGITWIGI